MWPRHKAMRALSMHPYLTRVQLACKVCALVPQVHVTQMTHELTMQILQIEEIRGDKVDFTSISSSSSIGSFCDMVQLGAWYRAA